MDRFSTCMRPVVGAVLLGTALSGGSAIAEGQPQQHDSSMKSGHSMSQGSQEMHQMHMDMMQKMPEMKMTGDTDKDFAMMMKHHHEQGVKMAEIEAKNGKSPEMKAMANKIIQAQKQEIKKLEDWLSKNRK